VNRLLVCLMSVTLEPKDAKVTPLLSKDLTNLPAKEGLMITVVYPAGSSDLYIATTHMRLSMSLRAQS
jgi:hypothetical protein